MKLLVHLNYLALVRQQLSCPAPSLQFDGDGRGIVAQRRILDGPGDSALFESATQLVQICQVVHPWPVRVHTVLAAHDESVGFESGERLTHRSA